MDSSRVGPARASRRLRLPDWPLAAVILTVFFSGCASLPAPTASGGASPTTSPPATEVSDETPTDLSAAAALGFAEAADDGTAAFCAPGRYTVITAEGPVFAMVSWGDQVALTLLDGEGAAEQREAIATELARYGADANGTVTLSLSPAASGARYTGGTTDLPGGGPPLLFWSKGDRARIQFGELIFADAEVRPL